jgi:hypothetical protein
MEQAQDMDKRLQAYLDSYLEHEESPALNEDADDGIPYDENEDIVDAEVGF